MIHLTKDMINTMHTITSPKTIIPNAPNILIPNTTNTVNKIAIVINTVNNIIIITSFN